MTMENPARVLAATLRQLADPVRAVPMRAYLLDQFAFLGLPAPVRRAALRDLIRDHPRDAAALLDTAAALWEAPERELRYTAIDLLRQHHRQLSPCHLPALQALLRRDSWWETVDGLGAVVNLVVRADRTAQAVMEEWLAHPDFWVRRTAMLHQLGWRLDTDQARLARHAAALAPEDEFFIRKAIGWALRDYARWNPAFVTGFLADGGAGLSALSRREASRRL